MSSTELVVARVFPMAWHRQGGEYFRLGVLRDVKRYEKEKWCSCIDHDRGYLGLGCPALALAERRREFVGA